MRPGTSRQRIPEPPVDHHPGDLDEVTFMRARNGDPAAQSALIKRYEKPVFSLLWRMAGPERAVVEDLTQETFLRALRSLRFFEYHGRARLVTWILTIASRLAVDHIRAARLHRDASQIPGGVPVALPAPDQDAHRRALGAALLDAIEALADPYRGAFLLREVHGLSYEEIASTLSIGVGTVKSRLARARGILQAALAEMHEA
jgi:RNA polymerase sigma-70 factor (ECF subfamily)